MDALSCSANVFDTPLALAVNVAVVVVLTEETVAVKFALVAPDATVTVAGTTTAELLLARLIVIPPVVAAALSVTVQLSVPAPVNVPLVQLSPFKTGVAAGGFSCRAKVSATLPEVAVSVAVCAVVTDVAVAVNPTLVAPATTVTVAGTVTAELLLARLIVTPLLVAAALSVAVQLSVPAPVIVPLVQLSPFRAGVAAGGFSCSANVFATPPALAVRVAVCAVVTDAAVAVNPALVAPDGTVTVAGKVTAELLLARLMVIPPLVAAALSVTVQLSVPPPVNDASPHISPLRTGVAAGGFSCTANISDTPPALAVRVAVCAVVTDAAVAVNPALVAPAGTVTLAGTVTAELLLARLIVIPPLVAAALNVTVQLSVPAPVIVPLVQFSPFRTYHPSCAT